MDAYEFLEKRVAPRLERGAVLSYCRDQDRTSFEPSPRQRYFVEITNERMPQTNRTSQRNRELQYGLNVIFGEKAKEAAGDLAEQLQGFEYWLTPSHSIRFSKKGKLFLACCYDGFGRESEPLQRARNFAYLHADFAAKLKTEAPRREARERQRRVEREEHEKEVFPFIPGSQYLPFGPHAMQRILRNR